MDGSASIELGKLFVGGLSWETSKEGLKEYFSQFGEVNDSVIMIDPITKRPRGFGFVTFADPASVKEVFKQPEHYIDNKRVDPKQATTKNDTPPAQSTQGVSKKVFIGGIAHGTTEQEVRDHFSSFGKVTEVDLKFDKNTQKLRGFGFVAFEEQISAEKACEVHYHQLKGKTVEAKKAEPRFATASAERAGAGPWVGSGYNAAGNYAYGGRSGGYGSAFPGYGYGYAAQQQQQHQQQQPAYGQYNYGGYGASGYGGQGYPQFPQTSASYDRGFYNAQQTGTTGQQQGYGQDSSAYGRTGYAGTEAYSGTHATAGYSYDTTAAANSFQQYGDSQATGYGRGVATQQRSMGSYQQQQQQQQPYANTH